MATNYTKWPQTIPNGHKVIPNGHNLYQIATNDPKWPQNIPNGLKMYQMTTKYLVIPNGLKISHKIYENFPFQGLQKYTKNWGQ
jgi:hypothetical protein